MNLTKKELRMIAEALYHYAGFRRIRTENLLSGEKYDKLASKIEKELLK